MPGIPEICTDAELNAVCRALGLKGRHIDVVRGIVDNLSDAEIADHLGLQPNTVHTYQRRLRRKLGVNDRHAVLLLVFATLGEIRDGGRPGARDGFPTSGDAELPDRDRP